MSFNLKIKRLKHTVNIPKKTEIIINEIGINLKLFFIFDFFSSLLNPEILVS